MDAVFWFVVHGVCMFAGWGVLIPLAVYVAAFERKRLGEKWIVWHQIFLYTAYAFITVAFIISMVIVKRPWEWKTHKVLGLLLYAWITVQVIVGLIVYYTDPDQKQKLLRKVHILSGYLMIITGLVNIGFGLADFKMASPYDDSVSIGYGLYVVSLLVVYLWARMHVDLEEQGHLQPLTLGPAPPVVYVCKK